MIEVKIIDKENGKAAIHSGNFCMCIIGTGKGSQVILFGDTNLFDFTKTAGTCFRTLLKDMSKRYSDPYETEFIARHLFLEKFFSETEKVLKGEETKTIAIVEKPDKSKGERIE